MNQATGYSTISRRIRSLANPSHQHLKSSYVKDPLYNLVREDFRYDALVTNPNEVLVVVFAQTHGNCKVY